MKLLVSLGLFVSLAWAVSGAAAAALPDDSTVVLENILAQPEFQRWPDQPKESLRQILIRKYLVPFLRKINRYYQALLEAWRQKIHGLEIPWLEKAVLWCLSLLEIFGYLGIAAAVLVLGYYLWRYSCKYFKAQEDPLAWNGKTPGNQGMDVLNPDLAFATGSYDRCLEEVRQNLRLQLESSPGLSDREISTGPLVQLEMWQEVQLFFESRAFAKVETALADFKRWYQEKLLGGGRAP